MIINTFSYLWSKTAPEAIEELVENGYTTFEIPISSPHCWPVEISSSERSATAAQLNGSGAKIRSLNAGGYDLNLASPAASVRRRSIEHIDAVIELATEWNVPDIVISPGTRRPMISPPLENVYGWLYESLEDLVPRAKKAGKRLLFENTPFCFTPTIEEIAAVVRTVDDDALRIVHDVANAAYIGDDPVAALKAHHELIGLMHISDTGTAIWGHDPIGTGVIDWEELGRAVESNLGVENVVLEIIRQENPLEEFAQAMRELPAFGWNLGTREEVAR
ncbi:sugar phosphate isomerase/epimerase family protein [Microbacterium capsulatum]|uniref:Sugar phosphate isomerase/epimerase family protein n=1 Tax=Microbacterium capsulatum TaxID=3041921 RepID=A0ABU0XF29_9MICO|nr:sugar phosphate isomerase/epimerase family protein [Microbacterium sp. ASV81]MDQ4213716.1 sugar phosphate isomerase/epimerase family protein [Microbacterium sp. ASV81]